MAAKLQMVPRHTRKTKQGEITRFIQMTVANFFINVLNREHRHKFVNLYELKGAIAREVEPAVFIESDIRLSPTRLDAVAAHPPLAESDLAFVVDMDGMPVKL